MPNYNGNAIYDYVVKKNLGYCFSVENNWLLLYGNARSVPKILALVNKVDNIDINNMSNNEKENVNLAYKIAVQLKLPFICVRFMTNSKEVFVLQSVKQWEKITYDQLRDLFEKYGVVEPGTARKPVNQYTSSPYHDWQRANLGDITVSDLDMVRYRANKIEKIVELKRSKVSIDKWKPFPQDYPNFALIINTIVNSQVKIPFLLYYNEMKEGEIGKRKEDISLIRVFKFKIPIDMIEQDQVEYYDCGKYTLDKALLDL